jgi:hypothetical protein
MRPVRRASITRIVERLGLRVGWSIRPGEPTIAWEVDTWFAPRFARQLPAKTINGLCLDISKSRVDSAWAAAAGYSVSVDPLTWSGPIVVKSERNGVHDGRVEHGPLSARRPDRVYQRYVDSVEGTSILEMRTVIVGGTIPIVIRRWRQAANWDRNSTRAEVSRTEDAYSNDEIRQLLAFAAAMNLDFAELDVLRDRNSGLIYVLDANRTPYGPPRSLSASDAAHAADAMSDAFARMMRERWP